MCSAKPAYFGMWWFSTKNACAPAECPLATDNVLLLLGNQSQKRHRTKLTFLTFLIIKQWLFLQNIKVLSFMMHFMQKKEI